MIEKALKEKLERIFGIEKVSFDQPGESFEQKTLFVEIGTCRSSIKTGRHVARVSGRLLFSAPATQVPLGFFSKRIAEALLSDTVDFFFFEFEENANRYQNLVERSLSFVFFYNEQYNPEVGTMSQLNTVVTEVTE